MNYIILNGQNSNEITGLLIQELPPIFKPKIRTQVEEIDGRDGDIVTKLGYSAYDKELSIGLYGNFDIDEIIAFFNSEGTVTFSNEPEKYYNYQILEQIDFERLVRFRTATVTFHVQPFKYSTEEFEETFNVANTNYLNITSLTSYRYSNGIPVEENSDITVDSFNSTNISFSVNANSYSLLLTNTITLDANTTYTLNYLRTDTNANQSRTYIYNVSDEDVYTINKQIITDGLISSTFTTGSNGKIALGFGVGNLSNGGTGTCSNIEINEGTVNNQISIMNNGNYLSKPIITIVGSGTINLSLNGYQIFVINLTDQENITIDAASMEAYSNGVLMNRMVTGNYENFVLNVGNNEISWSGNVTEIDIENYSRWI